MALPATWICLVSMLPALPRGDVPKAAIDEAVAHLTECKDIRAEICLGAAARLTLAGSAGARAAALGLAKMTYPGQVLAMSTITSDESEMGTTTLIKILGDAQVAVVIRSLAATSLSERKGGHATVALAQAAQDKDPGLRTVVVRAIGNRPHGGDPRVVRTLTRAATDAEASVRVEAIMGLGLSGLDNVGPQIVVGLTDADLRVQQAAAESLRLVRHDPAVVPLIEKLKTQDAGLRQTVSRALTKQTGKNFGEDYPLWKEWYAANTQ